MTDDDDDDEIDGDESGGDGVDGGGCGSYDATDSKDDDSNNSYGNDTNDDDDDDLQMSACGRSTAINLTLLYAQRKLLINTSEGDCFALPQYIYLQIHT